MRDIEDFDPLDDILLSDDETKESKVEPQTSLFDFSKSNEYENSKQKKQKMIAELFGMNQELKIEDNPSDSTIPNKSKWLDLKSDSKLENEMTTKINDFDKDINTQFNENANEENKSKEKNVHFCDNFAFTDRRKSEGSSLLVNMKKSKSRFKSLDLDLELDFDSSTIEPKSNTHFRNYEDMNDSTEETIVKTPTKLIDSHKKSNRDETTITESVYRPSSGLNRRSGTTKKDSQSGKSILTSFVRPETPKLIESEGIKDSLPTWLEPQKKNDRPSSASEAICSSSNKPKKESNYNDVNENIIDSSKFGLNIVDKIDTITSSEHMVSAVLELKQKQEELKKISQIHAETLSQHEREIQNSAIQLINQQRNNISALMQIMSFDNLFNKTSENLPNCDDHEMNSEIKKIRNTVSDLQSQIIRQQLEKTELEMKLQHAERKYEIDLTTLEDLYKYKLQIAEEKEVHFRKEMKSSEDEYHEKLLKNKQNEDELIRVYKEKIQTLQEDHIKEMKHVSQVHNLKSSFRGFVYEENNERESVHTDTELTTREIAIEDKQKQLLEFEERLNKEKVALEGKKASLEVRVEEFEIKYSKEKFNLEFQQKDFKLARNIFEEKETSWERERQREREFLNDYKQDLEIHKENLLKEEKKLMKQKFEIAVEKVKLETVMNSETNCTGRITDIVQNQAELKGQIEEIRNSKSKLESEWNSVKVEQMRLKEESWRLRDIEQQLKLQNKHFQKLIKDSETKREEGMEALKKARKIESQMNDQMENIGKRLTELNQKEEQLTQEKIEISKERDLLNKKKYQLDLMLPQLTYEEQLPFNIFNKNIMDPRIMLMKLKTENDLDSILRS